MPPHQVALARTANQFVARMSVATSGTVLEQPRMSLRSSGLQSLRAPRQWLPRINARPLLRRARLRFRYRAQAGHDPLPRIGGIDHLVDLQHGGDRDRLAVGVELVDLGAVVLLALDRVLDRFHLLAEAEPDVALQPHAAELARRPGHREERGVEAAADHGLRA